MQSKNGKTNGSTCLPFKIQAIKYKLENKFEEIEKLPFQTREVRCLDIWNYRVGVSYYQLLFDQQLLQSLQNWSAH